MQWAPSSPQAGKGYTGDAAGIPVNEDCLALNIWTTGKTDKPKPVMFYIHGGAYIAVVLPFDRAARFAGGDDRDLRLEVGDGLAASGLRGQILAGRNVKEEMRARILRKRRPADHRARRAGQRQPHRRPDFHRQPPSLAGPSLVRLLYLAES
ncbi:MAG: Carboxylesterase [Sphingomonas bacterium]|nr:Carboxylesterase [Sphingomonas bacterium]